MSCARVSRVGASGARVDRAGQSRTGGRRTWGRAVLGLAGAAVLGAAMSGCGAITGFAAPPCLPPEYSVSPAEASPGQTVTVSAPDAGCNPRYGSDAQIEVMVTDASGAEVFRGTAPMNDGGGFTYIFTIPADSAAGEATVTAMPYNVDWCDDTGRNNRAAESPDITLERVSCAMPVKPLMINR